eukprot:gnl/TRDRNA2_/TRDRNA2_166314_c0_seq2.p1 gnl/TRDRNA2_/TRDRNA2_166314_c0~~gnl/TRDRNA2_/TRDRNA2_166314_c0_seq2.p1  ORF type:complete len:135 (+),score=12.56 gnl/TRDRNA2_/TRDRNA2_166314_c0_seq2:48-452(+)
MANPSAVAPPVVQATVVQAAPVQAQVVGGPVQAQVVGGVPGQQMMVPGAVMPMVMKSGFGDIPQMITCQFCGRSGQTIVEHVPSNGTHLVAAAICCCTGCPCCFIPYIGTCCKEARHSCPSCRQVVGIKVFLTE